MNELSIIIRLKVASRLVFVLSLIIYGWAFTFGAVPFIIFLVIAFVLCLVLEEQANVCKRDFENQIQDYIFDSIKFERKTFGSRLERLKGDNYCKTSL